LKLRLRKQNPFFILQISRRTKWRLFLCLPPRPFEFLQNDHMLVIEGVGSVKIFLFRKIVMWIKHRLGSSFQFPGWSFHHWSSKSNHQTTLSWRRNHSYRRGSNPSKLKRWWGRRSGKEYDFSILRKSNNSAKSMRGYRRTCKHQNREEATLPKDTSTAPKRRRRSYQWRIRSGRFRSSKPSKRQKQTNSSKGRRWSPLIQKLILHWKCLIMNIY